MSASSLHRIATPQARAHVNQGRWIALCPRTDCTNAEGLDPRQGVFVCSVCKLMTGVDWPNNPDGIWEVLQRRPVPSTRNWYPADHEFAIRAGIEHGQSIADLIAENHEHGVD